MYNIYNIHVLHIFGNMYSGTHHCGACLAGIQKQLDHFQYLNIKSVWVSPFYRSPLRDSGYDVEDFRAIDPLFGTMQDFEKLLAEMHSKGAFFRFPIVFVCAGSTVGRRLRLSRCLLAHQV